VAVGEGNLIDLTGQAIEPALRPRPRQAIATLDLDRTLVHTNFNEAKVARLLEEHRGQVEVERTFSSESWWLLRSVAPGVRVRDLLREYRIETLREYRHRSREAINAARARGEEI
jgi:hypothetical protein